MWSFGVILFILLGGYQPFLVHDRQITLNRIVRGEIHFDPKYWHHVSREAKNLIRGLLTVNQDRRYTVEQALRHEWLIMRDSALETKKVNIAQLKKFQAQKRFRKGVNAVMAANKLKKIAKLVSSLRAENAAVASTKETDEPNGKLVESNISTETDAAESDDEDTADKKLLALENFLFVEEKPSLEMIQSIPHVFKLHYQLGEKIGSGGFAEVKAGININTKEEVAIKVIQTKDAPQPRLEAIRKEASILQDLDHPHIVKLFDFFEEEGTSYMVMEKLNGGELFDRIASKNHFTEAEARELSSTILKAIKHMHSRNIVHRLVRFSSHVNIPPVTLVHVEI
jgi:serine/threonine protein kinase